VRGAREREREITSENFPKEKFEVISSPSMLRARSKTITAVNEGQRQQESERKIDRGK
jgi:hypothetical protein